jgi:hypothetical protein
VARLKGAEMDAAVVGLIGVAAGGVLTFTTAATTVWSQNRQERRNRREAQLDYRRQLVRDFLFEAHLAEDRLRRTLEFRVPMGDVNLAQLWFTQKYLTIVVVELDETSEAYAKVLDDHIDRIMKGEDPQTVGRGWDEQRLQFMDACRRYVSGITRKPVSRRPV